MHFHEEGRKGDEVGINTLAFYQLCTPPPQGVTQQQTDDLSDVL